MGSFISTAEHIKEHYCPTSRDVFAVRSFLLAFVPAELANLILNEANYWPKVTMRFEPENPLVIAANWDNPTFCCLLSFKVSEVLSDGPSTIKMICFKIISHDQGWCDENNNFPGMM
jgi:hypothetical protein